MTGMEHGFVRITVGGESLRLRYRRAGSEGPTILLLHGWPQTGHAWRLVMPTLAESGYTIIAPDLRGSGDSDRPSGGYDAETRMEDARKLLRVLEMQDAPIYVVGHGDGGASVAQVYAQSYPDEVAALALVSAASGDAAPHWMQGFHQTPDLPELLIGPQIEPYLRHLFQSWSHDPQMMAETDLAVYVRALSAPGALRASLAPFRAETKPASSAENPVPTLWLRGESDPRHANGPPAPNHGGAGKDPSHVQTIPRGGFWLPEERPDPVAAALLTFFGERRDQIAP